MAEQALSESRFYMWRAVFALAHTDGQVSADEIAFAHSYLENAPFSAEQKRILAEDLTAPQNVAAMLARVEDLSDQADFFQFAHMMAWQDGHYAETERQVMARLQGGQMEGLDIDGLRRSVRAARQASVLRSAAMEEVKAAAPPTVSGLADVIRFVVPWSEMRRFQAPDAEMFALWRAVFSLAHADDELAEEERGYIEGMMDVFRFTPEQKGVIQQDMDRAPDTLALFGALKDKVYRKQFFVLGRTVLWCDGFLHEKETQLIGRIKSYLGDAAADYGSELRWIDRRPDAVTMNDWETGEEVMMKSVVRQMLDFYQYMQNRRENVA